MDAKLFKSVTLFRNKGSRASKLNSNLEGLNFDNYEVVEPGATQWRTMGFAQVSPNEFVMNISGAGYLALIQMNERALPAATVKEGMAKKIAHIQETEGRVVNKKEYASLRDEVQQELLPRAFIRRKLVPVIFAGDNIFVFSSSTKLTDDVVTLVFGAVGNDKLFQPVRLANLVTKEVQQVLTSYAQNGADDDEDNADYYFAVSKNAVLAGPDKKVIRVKDVDIGGDDVQRLLKHDFEATALGLDYYEGGVDPVASFTVNTNLVLSKLAQDGIKAVDAKATEADKADAFTSSAWLTAVTLKAIVKLLIQHHGGLKKEDGDDDL